MRLGISLQCDRRRCPPLGVVDLNSVLIMLLTGRCLLRSWLMTVETCGLRNGVLGRLR